MRRFAGQAARHAGGVLHAVGTIVVVLAVATALAAGALAWRLAQGPLDMAWLARRLEAAANADNGATRLQIGTASLAWEGFRHGVDAPLDIRLTNVRAVDPAGAPVAEIPRADVSLSVASLLVGRLRPRTIEVDHAQLRLLRGPDGAISLDLGSLTPNKADDTGASPGPGLLPGVITNLAGPAGNDRRATPGSFISQLRRVRVRDTSLAMIDRQLGVTWQAPLVNLDLARRRQGGLDGSGQATLAVGDQSATLRLFATLEPGGTRTLVEADFSSVRPAALARAVPSMAALAGVDLPVSLVVRADLGPELQLQHASLQATAGAGQVILGHAGIAVEKVTLAAAGNAAAVTLSEASILVRGHLGGPVSRISASGQATRAGAKLRAGLVLGIDQVEFADLPRLWPAGAGGGGRSWVTQNITAGTARDGHVEVALEAPPDLSNVTLSSATGIISGEELTVHWLRPVPPIEHGRAKLRILDPDTLEISVDGGQQHADTQRGDPLTIHGGRVRITGLEHPDQIGTIDAEIGGGLAEVITLLKNPRLRLLDKHPVPLHDPAGHASVKLHLQLPLEDKVKIDDVAVRALAHLTDVHLADLAAGRDLDAGTLDLDASGDGMTLNGQAQLAGIASRLAAELDFRAGPPSQVLQKITVSGQASAAQLKAAGLDAGPLLSGTTDLHAVLTERRDGRGTVEADADLTQAELTAAPVAWRKPAGSPAHGSARVVLVHDHLSAIDAIALDGKDLSVHGTAQFGNDHATTLRIDRVVLGQTQARGTVRFPPPNQPARPIEVAFDGPSLDLSAVAEHRPATASSKPETPKPSRPDAPGPAWMIDARFDRVMVANGGSFDNLTGRAEDDGTLFRRLQVEGRTAPNQPFRFEIAPQGGGRQLTASATDAGALLRGLDLVGTMQGGRLAVTGAYDDRSADHPLRGTAELTDFRVRDPRGLGRLLQAMTLYGLVQVAARPGARLFPSHRAVHTYRGRARIGRRTRVQSVARRDRDGARRSAAERRRCDGHHRPGVFLQFAARQPAAGGPIVQPGEGRRAVCGQLRRARTAERPESQRQSFVGPDARVPARRVPSILTKIVRKRARRGSARR